MMGTGFWGVWGCWDHGGTGKRGFRRCWDNGDAGGDLGVMGPWGHWEKGGQDGRSGSARAMGKLGGSRWFWDHGDTEGVRGCLGHGDTGEGDPGWGIGGFLGQWGHWVRSGGAVTMGTLGPGQVRDREPP